MESILEITNLNAGYADSQILKGVNLHVNKNEIVAIVGPNGAGKSTVMKAVFGLLNIYQGSIEYHHKPIHTLTTDQIVHLGISYVPQLANVFTDLTIHENLRMGGFFKGKDWTNIADQVYGSFPDLAKVSNQLAGRLSGGQRQMLAMGRALMQQPDLLLLDEPTAGLSPKYMEQIFTMIQQIQSNNLSVLIVEQHAKQVLNLSDRGYVLANGKNAFTGKGSELLANKEVVQSFLGG